MTQQNPKLFLTGASGLLGRSIYKIFKQKSWIICGTALSRNKGDLTKLDITQEDAVIKAIQDFKPDIVIHCAAQRMPDVVDKDPVAARRLNVDATSYIVKAAGLTNTPVLYISTDYVFDGTTPPYKITDKTNPLNLYGKSKLDGEEEVLKNKGNLVLRIPVLYGNVETLQESAVTCLLTPLLNIKSPASVSHTEWRCPSHVDDIAHICFNLASAVTKGEKLNGIFHWCGDEKMTKYEMIMKMAKVFNLPSDHVTANLDPGTNVVRPRDTELEKSSIQNLGFGQHTVFEEGIKSALSPWVKKQ